MDITRIVDSWFDKKINDDVGNNGFLLRFSGSQELDSTTFGEYHYVYPIGIKAHYKENERVKFRLGVRKRYIQKTFSTSVQTTTGSFIPEGSGSYSIIDIASGETMVPFGAYTSMSCDSTSPYMMIIKKEFLMKI